ncbi:MAG: single-stranded DNA-binding protein [Turicibacter sp.]|nr:single-stranded DNA-binding protein [Turicibacter sp.]
MNKVILCGYFTGKPELLATTTKKQYTRFTIAVNRTWGDKKADFCDCIAWEGLAGGVAKYCDKGSRVIVEGRLTSGSFVDKQGNKRYTTEVVAESVQFLSTGNKDSGQGFPSQQQAQNGQQAGFVQETRR